MPDPADLQTGLARPTPAAVPDLGLDSSLRNAAAAAPVDPGSNVVTFPSPRQSGPAPSGRPSATDMLQYLLDKGETPVVAQGIVNRLAKESSFNPLEIGDNGTSFGLAQWHNERAVGLFNYGKATGRSPADWRMQLDYMRHEMETTESPTRERLKQATTPQEAEQIFTASFERPAATHAQLQQNTRGSFNEGAQTFVDGLLDNLRRANDRYDAQIRAAQEPRELERLLVAKYLNESQAPPQNMHQA